jgi:MFS transporter, FSR family, fosmidomycin resistance protein
MVLRTFIQQSFLTFTPILYSREGHSLVSIGLVISLYTVAGTASGLLSGHLSDRIGYKPIFYVTFILATPALFLMLLLQGEWIYLASTLAGFLMFATLPLGLVMAQKLAPNGKSMVSSLMMGLAQGVGGMMTPLVGSLADLFSIRTVLFGLALVPLLSIALVRFFPEKRLREKTLAG